MTDEEIKKIYKDQLDQHYLNFLEKEKEEISKLNLNSEILKKYYYNGAKSIVKVINTLSKQESKVITSSTKTQTNLLTELDNIADKFVKKNIKEILEFKDRTKAGETAPAKGLFLYKVFYENNK